MDRIAKSYIRHRILITDVTSMSDQYVCIACLNEQRECLRLDLPFRQRFTIDHLFIDREKNIIVCPSGVFNIKGTMKMSIDPPHLEDFALSPDGLRFEKYTSMQCLFTNLSKIAYKSVHQAFEENILENRFTQPGMGSRSLVSIMIKHVQSIRRMPSFKDTKKIRYAMTFRDQADRLFQNIPITDLYFINWAFQHHKRNSFVWEHFFTHLCNLLNNSPTILRMGVTRPFQEKCWLQIDGIHNLEFLEKYKPFSMIPDPSCVISDPTPDHKK